MAYVKRFINILRNSTDTLVGPMVVDELRAAEHHIYKIIKNQHGTYRKKKKFVNMVNSNRNHIISTGSNIRSDDKGILRLVDNCDKLK